MKDRHINKQDIINDLKQEIRKLKEECVRYIRIYQGTVEDKNKLWEKNNEAKEIIREYLKLTESWNYDFADVLKCNKKAEAFLKE